MENKNEVTFYDVVREMYRIGSEKVKKSYREGALGKFDSAFAEFFMGFSMPYAIATYISPRKYNLNGEKLSVIDFLSKLEEENKYKGIVLDEKTTFSTAGFLSGLASIALSLAPYSFNPFYDMKLYKVALATNAASLVYEVTRGVYDFYKNTKRSLIEKRKAELPENTEGKSESLDDIFKK